MLRHLKSWCFLLLVLPTVVPGSTDALLSVTAEPAIVHVARLPERAQPLRLPSLEFRARIDAACPQATDIESVSVSVADTRAVFGASDFETANRLEAVVKLPEQQMAPLRLGRFCLLEAADADTDGDSPNVLRIDDLFTAHASLRCRSDSGPVVLYETLGLHLELRCGIDEVDDSAE